MWLLDSCLVSLSKCDGEWLWPSLPFVHLELQLCGLPEMWSSCSVRISSNWPANDYVNELLSVFWFCFSFWSWTFPVGPLLIEYLTLLDPTRWTQSGLHFGQDARSCRLRSCSYQCHRQSNGGIYSIRLDPFLLWLVGFGKATISMMGVSGLPSGSGTLGAPAGCNCPT